MLDNKRIGKFIAEKRKNLSMTQEHLANRLSVSFQAVSKWENGYSLPNVEMLYELAEALGVTTDEILHGKEAEGTLSYRKAGVDITYTDTIKSEMQNLLLTNDQRVLNGVGPFASLYNISFPDMKNPVLVLKTEEPGSKQKLAMEYGYTESICYDLINHLVNDIAVMGARPLAVQDSITCSFAEKDTIHTFIKGMAKACQLNECSLVGGETSIQPQVLEKGTYVLSANIAGVVERDRVIDGSRVQEGDVILAVSSNGLHTNGYSLVRMLIDQAPQIKNERLGNETFLQKIMKPHTAYYPMIKELNSRFDIHGMAHITGGGMEGNLCRIIQKDLCAVIDFSLIRPLDVFRVIKEWGNISDKEMRTTFNCGVGLILVAENRYKSDIINVVKKFADCYEIGMIEQGEHRVAGKNQIPW